MMSVKDLNKLNKSLEGKKTYASAGLLLIFDIINSLYPDLMDSEQELIIQKVLSYLIYYGLVDKIWRNRKKISIFVVDIINKLIKKKENGR